MEHDIDSSEHEVEISFQPEMNGIDLIEKEASFCQKKRKQIQDLLVDERKKLKICENKRKKLEKPSSAHQREQLIVRVAKEELEHRKKNAEIFAQDSRRNGNNGSNNDTVSKQSLAKVEQWPSFVGPSNEKSQPTISASASSLCTI